MYYPKRKPVEERFMILPASGENTICQLLRDIYRLTENAEIKLKTRVGVAMAKAMMRKLKSRKVEAGQHEHP